MIAISNRLLTVLLVAAMVVSIGGALINISKLTELTRVISFPPLIGLVTVGTVNITLTSNVQINLSTYQIEFGPGYVTAGTIAARLNTSSGWKGKENWTNATNYNFGPNNITIENTGNRNASVNFTSDKLAAAFLGGGVGDIPDPSFQYRGVLKDTGTCDTTLNLTTSYTEVITANANKVCDCMRFEDANDELFFNAQVFIPQDASTGQKNATLTFSASDWSGSNKIC